MARSLVSVAGTLSFCALLAACGGGSSDGGPDGGEGGAGDARGEDATPVPIDPTPILERTPRLEATCSVAQALDNVGTNIGGVELYADGATPTLAYVQGGFPASVEIAPLTTAPGFAIGTSTVTIDDQGANRLVASFPDGDLTVLAWLSYVGDENQLRLARVDGTGAFATTPRSIAGLSFQYGELPRVFPRGDGLGLAWIEGTYPNRRLKVRRLDAEGAPRADAVDLGPARALGDLVALDDGTILLAFAGEADAQYSTDVWTQRLAADLTPLAAARRVSPGANDALSFTSPVLLARGDGYLISFVESKIDYVNEAAHDVVVLAHLDADGAIVGALHRLTAPVEDTSHVRPVLFERGEHVGLAWSAGTIIYICAGCMPDHALRVVLLDGDDLVPVSTPIELVGDSGLFTDTLAPLGDDLLALFEVVYHVHADVAAALLHCE